MEDFNIAREVAADVRSSEMFAEADAREELGFLDGQDVSEYDDEPDYDGQDWADGDHDSTMTSIGWGTDEDYGYYGDGTDDYGYDSDLGGEY